MASHQGSNVISSFRLDVSGLGLLFYSPFSAAAIRDGEDYLQREFFDPYVVEKQALEGRLVGVSTGSSGSFLLGIYSGYPEDSIVGSWDFKLRLGVEVRDEMLCIRDLYDLLDWRPNCPPEQTIHLDDGFYHVTLLSSMPKSGVLGDNQSIDVYLQRLPEFPSLAYNGIPALC